VTAGTRGAATVREPFHRLLSRLTALAFFAASAAPVQAGCALCREAAASQRQEAIDALNLGIIDFPTLTRKTGLGSAQRRPTEPPRFTARAGTTAGNSRKPRGISRRLGAPNARRIPQGLEPGRRIRRPAR